MKYSLELDPEKSAKAYGRELHCSPKHCENIARAIKGMMVKEAKQYLQDVINFKRAIPFKTHNTERAHKKGMGPGAYPQKACKLILKVIENAENNAEYKGLDPENMYIAHISTYRGRIIKSYMPRAFGRATAWHERTTNVEIIIAEKEGEEEKEERKRRERRKEGAKKVKERKEKEREKEEKEEREGEEEKEEEKQEEEREGK